VESPHILIIESRYYEDVADDLVRGALEALEAGGATTERLDVPGAFELPAALRYAVGTARFDGFVVLGCVVRGETAHFDIVAYESARAIQELVCEHSLALGFGLLTVDTREQARRRADQKGGNKGAEAARACLRMIDLRHRLRPTT
jgi:6,7-dimethyl-8-ribityllumazine synthase